MNKLRRNINQLYRFSNLNTIGWIGLIGFSLVFVCAIILWLIPYQSTINKEKFNEAQYIEIDAVEVKNNTDYFSLFLEKVRNNNGYLILGTSESGSKNGYNYWELLNSDPEIKDDFSIFYGAGRFCEKYIPFMLNKPEDWKNQKLLVFVNPTYWRNGLNNYSAEYHSRYLSQAQLLEGLHNTKNIDKYTSIFQLPRIDIEKEVNQFADIQFFHQFSVKLNHLLGNDEKSKSPFTNSNNSTPWDSLFTSEKLKQITSDIIDTNFNCSYDFISHVGTPKLTLLDKESTYRYQSLEYFFALCDSLDIQATYIIGPYNKRIGLNNNNKEIIADYDQLMSDLTLFFSEHNRDFIDLNYLSNEPYVFLDMQHNGEYGGYLIYQAIKKKLYE